MGAVLPPGYKSKDSSIQLVKTDVWLSEDWFLHKNLTGYYMKEAVSWVKAWFDNWPLDLNGPITNLLMFLSHTLWLKAPCSTFVKDWSMCISTAHMNDAALPCFPGGGPTSSQITPTEKNKERPDCKITTTEETNMAKEAKRTFTQTKKKNQERLQIFSLWYWALSFHRLVCRLVCTIKMGIAVWWIKKKKIKKKLFTVAIS